MWISNAPFADIAVVWAKKMKKEGFMDWLLNVVWKGSPLLKRTISGLYALHQLN
jgi:hypothetical protein